MFIKVGSLNSNNNKFGERFLEGEIDLQQMRKLNLKGKDKVKLIIFCNDKKLNKLEPDFLIEAEEN